MIVDVNPPLGVGPVLIGQTVAEAELRMRLLPGYRAADHGHRLPGFAHYDSDLAIAVHWRDHLRIVESIEVFRPARSVGFAYRGIDLFGTPVDAIAFRLRQFTRVEIEDDGHTVLAPDLYLAIGRRFLPGRAPAGEDPAMETHAESVLVAAPGYHDQPWPADPGVPDQ